MQLLLSPYFHPPLKLYFYPFCYPRFSPPLIHIHSSCTRLYQLLHLKKNLPRCIRAQQYQLTAVVKLLFITNFMWVLLITISTIILTVLSFYSFYAILSYSSRVKLSQPLYTSYSTKI